MYSRRQFIRICCGGTIGLLAARAHSAPPDLEQGLLDIIQKREQGNEYSIDVKPDKGESLDYIRLVFAEKGQHIREIFGNVSLKYEFMLKKVTIRFTPLEKGLGDSYLNYCQDILSSMKLSGFYSDICVLKAGDVPFSSRQAIIVDKMMKEYIGHVIVQSGKSMYEKPVIIEDNLPYPGKLAQRLSINGKQIVLSRPHFTAWQAGTGSLLELLIQPAIDTLVLSQRPLVLGDSVLGGNYEAASGIVRRAEEAEYQFLRMIAKHTVLEFVRDSMPSLKKRLDQEISKEYQEPRPSDARKIFT